MNSPLATSYDRIFNDEKYAEGLDFDGYESGDPALLKGYVRGMSRKDYHYQVSRASTLFTIVGIGYLFPFSALTQPVDYWSYLFPDFNIEFDITSTFMYTNLTMLALIVFFGGNVEYVRRIYGGFLGQVFVLIVVPTSYFLITSENWNYYVILGATAFVAIVTAFIDSALISLAAQFPLKVQESFQLGIGLSTLIGSLYRDITKISFSAKDTVLSSLLYFYSGAATIVVCMGAFKLLLEMPLTQNCIQNEFGDEKKNLLPLPEEDWNSVDSPHKDSKKYAASNRFRILRKILFNEIMVLLLFTSTLALWPPLVTEMKSYNFPELQENGWWPLILLTIFSILDCIGRLLVRYRGCITRRNVWIPVLLRFIFVPLIICSVRGIFFTCDFWSILFVAGLGFTNGYHGTLTIILVNECVEPSEIPIAGTFTSFFLNAGLVLGATLGIILNNNVVKSE